VTTPRRASRPAPGAAQDTEGQFPDVREPCAVCGQPLGRLGRDGMKFMDGKFRHHVCAGDPTQGALL
jgi:hypothetical protein